MASKRFITLICFSYFCFTSAKFTLKVTPNPLEIGKPAFIELSTYPSGEAFPTGLIFFNIDSTLLVVCEYATKEFSMDISDLTSNRKVADGKITFTLKNVKKEYHNLDLKVQPHKKAPIATMKLSLFSKPTVFELKITHMKTQKKNYYEDDEVRAQCTIKGQFPQEQIILTVPFKRSNIKDDEIMSKATDSAYATGVLKPNDNGQEVKCKAGVHEKTSILNVYYAPRFESELKFDDKGQTKCVVTGNPKPKVRVIFNDTGIYQGVAKVMGEDGLQLNKDVKDGQRLVVMCRANNTFPNGTVNSVSKTYDVVVPTLAFMEASNPDSDKSRENSGKGLKLSNTAIIAIVVIVIVLIIIVGIVVYLKKSRSSSSRSEHDKEYQSVPQNKTGFGGKEHDANAYGMNGQQSPSDQVTYAQLNYSDMPRNRKPMQVTSDTTTQYAEIVGVMDRGTFTKQQPANV